MTIFDTFIGGRQIGQENLNKMQTRMKVLYDRKARERTFDVDAKVLVLLPIVGNPLQARYYGPFTIERHVNDVGYVMITPDRRKQRQLYHVNMLKEYHAEDGSSDDTSITPVALLATDRNVNLKVDDNNLFDDSGIRLNNAQVTSNLQSKLGHLSVSQAADLGILIPCAVFRCPFQDRCCVS